MKPARTFADFFARASADGEKIALISVASAEGSTPREADAAMMVGARETFGTIGGGRLEWDAIAAARDMLARGEDVGRLVVPLGPEIGQCCGGRVTLSFQRIDDIQAAQELDAAAEQDRRDNAVYIFGAGHVGVALARALAPLPMAVRLIDSRPGVFDSLTIDGVPTIATEQLTREVENAPANSAFIILTHSHALDSLIAAAVLERGDFRYLGIIGSKTKRRLFEKAFREIGIAEDRIARIVSPIGGNQVKDKRPTVIAALVAAELIVAQAAQEATKGKPKQKEAA